MGGAERVVVRWALVLALVAYAVAVSAALHADGDTQSVIMAPAPDAAAESAMLASSSSLARVSPLQHEQLQQQLSGAMKVEETTVSAAAGAARDDESEDAGVLAEVEATSLAAATEAAALGTHVGNAMQATEALSAEMSAMFSITVGTEAIVTWTLQGVTALLKFYSGKYLTSQIKHLNELSEMQRWRLIKQQEGIEKVLEELKSAALWSWSDATENLKYFEQNVKLAPLDGDEGLAEYTAKVAPKYSGALDPRQPYITAMKQLWEAMSTDFGHDPTSVVGKGEISLKEFAQVVATLKEIATEAEALSKAEGTTKDTLKEMAKRMAADTTLGQFRYKPILKTAAQSVTAFLQEFTKVVLSSYVGVLWAGFDLYTASKAHYEFMQKCANLREDYESLSNEATEDVQYSACRGMILVVEQKLRAYTTFEQLARQSRTFLPEHVHDELLSRARAAFGRWTEVYNNIEKSCSAFVNAKPPVYDQDLIAGSTTLSGYLKVKRRLTSKKCWCFVPLGASYMQCNEVSDEEFTSGAAPNMHTLLAKTPFVVVDLLEISTVLSLRTKLLKRDDQKLILILEYASTLTASITLKGVDDESISRWSRVIDEIRQHSPDADSYGTSFVLKDLVQTPPHMVVHSADFSRNAGILGDRIHHLRQSARPLLVSTQYRDRTYSPLSTVLTPSEPEYTTLVHTMALVSVVESSPISEALWQVAAVDAITSVIVVPVGTKEHAAFLDKKCSDEISGPFRGRKYQFVCAVRPDPANPRHTIHDDEPALWVPKSLPLVKSTINRIADRLPQKLTGVRDKLEPAPYVNFRVAYSKAPGVPISAVGLCSRKTKLEGWHRIPMFVETDKDADGDCYGTHLGATKKSEDTALCAVKDRRIFKGQLQQIMQSAVTEFVGRVASTAQSVSGTREAMKVRYAEWRKKEDERLAEEARKRKEEEERLERERVERERRIKELEAQRRVEEVARLRQQQIAAEKAAIAAKHEAWERQARDEKERERRRVERKEKEKKALTEYVNYETRKAAAREVKFLLHVQVMSVEGLPADATFGEKTLMFHIRRTDSNGDIFEGFSPKVGMGDKVTQIEARVFDETKEPLKIKAIPVSLSTVVAIGVTDTGVWDNEVGNESLNLMELFAKQAMPPGGYGDPRYDVPDARMLLDGKQIEPVLVSRILTRSSDFPESKYPKPMILDLKLTLVPRSA